MPTINPNDVKNFIDDLYHDGLTNNEKLQDLMWRLKMVSELTNEELGINSDNDPRYFFITFLTDLANRYRHTNTSQLPPRLLSIHSSTLDIKERFNQIASDFHRDIYLAKMEGKQIDYDSLINQITSQLASEALSSLDVIRLQINDWLRECNY